MSYFVTVTPSDESLSMSCLAADCDFEEASLIMIITIDHFVIII
jgi:hypothetical protein